MGNIQIIEIGEPSPHVDCAGRIARLLAIAMQDSEWVHECNGAVSVTHYLCDPERVIIKGILSGHVNRIDFSLPFESDYQIDMKLGAHEFISSPIFMPLLAIFRASYYEQDPDKRANDWLTRSELEIASKLEAKVNRLVGAPLEGIRVVWRQALLRFIGVKTLIGLRILSIIAALVCFGIAANFARLLVLP